MKNFKEIVVKSESISPVMLLDYWKENAEYGILCNEYGFDHELIDPSFPDEGICEQLNIIKKFAKDCDLHYCSYCGNFSTRNIYEGRCLQCISELI
jgi:hypothetical protein